ncbi:DUF4189 domain-containing protein [Stenotrophomonas ginsengisoli]|uniref:DUF4189 domain-containing protein n=1 Tax=Stenotrophomonas ginsengisoli TaxID=336566 RepID=UPI0009FA8DE2|nr:DUF4189 domain-containing protein [Stenotrophomonas ginsengisoli]
MRNLLLSIFFMISISSFDVSRAQSACASGVVAGSQSCGEDGAAPNYRAVRYPGYGAFVYSPSVGVFFSTIGANDTTRRDREQDALSNCRAAGNTDCYLLGSWQNSCATVAKLTNADGVHPLFATGDNTRVSRREVRRLCGSMDPDGVCDIRKSHCIRPYVQLVPY